ncbi:MAG: hypothetical protein IIC26_04205 [Chloroflexi bacterium]|nr:hypothetical protein [Chloroflexota bacterium]
MRRDLYQLRRRSRSLHQALEHDVDTLRDEGEEHKHRLGAGANEPEGDGQREDEGGGDPGVAKEVDEGEEAAEGRHVDILDSAGDAFVRREAVVECGEDGKYDEQQREGKPEPAAPNETPSRCRDPGLHRCHGSIIAWGRSRRERDRSLAGRASAQPEGHRRELRLLR